MEIKTVNGGGNVGIGSAWPGQALDIVGAMRVSSNIFSRIGCRQWNSFSLQLVIAIGARKRSLLAIVVQLLEANHL